MSDRSDTGRTSGGAETDGDGGGGGGYDAIAGAYAERKLHQGVQPYVHQMLDALTAASQASTAPLRSGSVVADIGCGIGVELQVLAARGWPAIGLDPSAALLVRARAATAHPLVRADARQLPLGTASLDAVVSVHALVHLDPADLPMALGEVTRVLRPGACAAISLLTGTGTVCEEVAYAPGHWRTFTYWTPPPLMDVAAAAGLEVVRVEQTPQAGGTTWTILRHPVRGPEAISRRRR